MLEQILNEIFKYLGVEGRADMVVLNEEEMRSLNLDKRGVDAPTDVLSFPNLTIEAGKIPDLSDYPLDAEDGKLFLGDVAICLPVIKRQAQERGVTEAEETVHMLIHSALHLLGYDHCTDEQENMMNALAEEVAGALAPEFGIVKLIDAARKAAVFAYAPYSNFAVGAAVQTVDGEIFGGCNVENASYGATICAERTAVVKAVSAGQNQITAVCVYHAETKAYPCGMCLQVLSEFCAKSVPVIIADDNGYEIFAFSGLLPQAFGGLK